MDKTGHTETLTNPHEIIVAYKLWEFVVKSNLYKDEARAAQTKTLMTLARAALDNGELTLTITGEDGEQLAAIAGDYDTSHLQPNDPFKKKVLEFRAIAIPHKVSRSPKIVA